MQIKLSRHDKQAPPPSYGGLPGLFDKLLICFMLGEVYWRGFFYLDRAGKAALASRLPG